ncbi:isoaspartyl dipeptidase with L-asparaginase activity (plasmid) [Legionella adelaidensis]|uniref:Isoaspartyl peptidase n=1 Tax=Legionella adelaidensis TaxID=45056 RepID=A0A0W0R1Q1_9GAMM|nr:isoaspartyl peptidase/L-asparaginase [Legionella adelaidensis]KTC64926.1 isoaspartyl dipeptidase with L-asparaginase activity [Legionella adelaidensis]VEH85609.1 isoaspartyl dipeptidase with L-asparaginase activity [Legionella adelaidensis]
MKKIAIAVHGGASEETKFLKSHIKESEEGLAEAAEAGYRVLKNGGSALDAVEIAVRSLEDNPMFNAGCGSALNCKGEVEMDASIMDGSNLDAGAVSMVRHVKNPISLARIIMEKTHHILLSGYGALEFAEINKLHLEPDSYFITPHQYEIFKELNEIQTKEEVLANTGTGTVGAVALDMNGNLAAGTSTGGTSNCLAGRIGDSCHIGAGCYANNNTCAVSGTGEGEFLIRGVVAHTIAMMMEHNMSLKEACHYVLFERDKILEGGMGVIAVSKDGEVGISFNTEIMKRAWMTTDNDLRVAIYK